MGWPRAADVPPIKNSGGRRDVFVFGAPAGRPFSRGGGWEHPCGVCRVVSAVVKLLVLLGDSAPRVGTQDTLRGKSKTGANREIRIFDVGD